MTDKEEKLYKNLTFQQIKRNDRFSSWLELNSRSWTGLTRYLYLQNTYLDTGECPRPWPGGSSGKWCWQWSIVTAGEQGTQIFGTT